MYNYSINNIYIHSITYSNAKSGYIVFIAFTYHCFQLGAVM